MTAARAAGGAALFVALSVLAAGIHWGSTVGGGADSYGYVSQAGQWRMTLDRKGAGLAIEEEIARQSPWPLAIETWAPLGYLPAAGRRDAIVPLYCAGASAADGALSGRRRLLRGVPRRACVRGARDLVDVHPGHAGVRRSGSRAFRGRVRRDQSDLPVSADEPDDRRAGHGRRRPDGPAAHRRLAAWRRLRGGRGHPHPAQPSAALRRSRRVAGSDPPVAIRLPRRSRAGDRHRRLDQREALRGSVAFGIREYLRSCTRWRTPASTSDNSRAGCSRRRLRSSFSGWCSSSRRPCVGRRRFHAAGCSLADPPRRSHCRISFICLSTRGGISGSCCRCGR